MKQQYKRIPFLSVLYISEERENMASVVPRPGQNPNCASAKILFLSHHFNSRELIKDVKSFPT
jgi:hypothetical protein